MPKVLYFYGTHTEYRSVWKYKQQCIKKWSWVSTLWYTYITWKYVGITVIIKLSNIVRYESKHWAFVSPYKNSKLLLLVLIHVKFSGRATILKAVKTSQLNRLPLATFFHKIFAKREKRLVKTFVSYVFDIKILFFVCHTFFYYVRRHINVNFSVCSFGCTNVLCKNFR